MPRRCTICDHPQRQTIDAALVADAQPLAGIASLFVVSQPALRRHRAAHLPTMMAQASAAAEVVRADDLLQQARDLQGKALSILEQAEAAGELRTAVSAIREARGCLELLARLLGEMPDAATINLFINPQWTSALQVVMVALQPYPEARIAVADRLAELDP